MRRSVERRPRHCFFFVFFFNPVIKYIASESLSSPLPRASSAFDAIEEKKKKKKHVMNIKKTHNTTTTFSLFAPFFLLFLLLLY